MQQYSKSVKLEIRYLMKINADVPTAANVRSYIDIVREKSTLRKLIAACKNITRECYTQDKELQDVLTGAEKAIFDIVMNRQEGEELKRSLRNWPGRRDRSPVYPPVLRIWTTC